MTDARRLPCPRCGIKRQVSEGRENSDCSSCKTVPVVPPSNEHAFTDRWVRRGGILVPVVKEPRGGRAKLRPRGRCIDCGTDIDPRAHRCRTCNGIAQRGPMKSTIYAPIWQTIADNLAATTNPPLGTCCDDCGCLLVGPDETCPGCLVTAGVSAQEVA